jgi:hypothetical protein
VLIREAKSRFEFRIALPQTGRFADLKSARRVYFGFDPAARRLLRSARRTCLKRRQAAAGSGA